MKPLKILCFSLILLMQIELILRYKQSDESHRSPSKPPRETWSGEMASSEAVAGSGRSEAEAQHIRKHPVIG